jgi:hypothetical protein
VRIPVAPGEHALVSLDAWRRMITDVEAELEAEIRRFTMQAVAREDLERDPETGEYRRAR